MVLFLPRPRDDLIKISGQWVYPLEVELCLAEHPDVRECAVFAAELPDRRMTLKAVVVLNSQAFDEGDATKMLQDFVKAKLLPYKYPREVNSSTNCRRPAPAKSTGRRCCGCKPLAPLRPSPACGAAGVGVPRHGQQRRVDRFPPAALW